MFPWTINLDTNSTFFAASRTASFFINFSAFNPVLYLEDCGQYEQSSLHPPVFIERSVHCCTSLNLWTFLWTWAYKRWQYYLIKFEDKVTKILFPPFTRNKVNKSSLGWNDITGKCGECAEQNNEWVEWSSCMSLLYITTYNQHRGTKLTNSYGANNAYKLWCTKLIRTVTVLHQINNVVIT